jgi:hypothetical protein
VHLRLVDEVSASCPDRTGPWVILTDRPLWHEREACHWLRPGGRLGRTVMREQKLPGKPRPRTEMLAEYQAQRAKVRPEMWVLRDLFLPPPEEMLRWRVQLDCGCIHERLSHKAQTYPSEWQEREAVTQRHLPKGQVSCRHDDDVWSEYQEIASWGDAPDVREFGPDPIEARHGIDPKTWAKIRRDEPRKVAFWPVELSCDTPLTSSFPTSTGSPATRHAWCPTNERLRCWPSWTRTRKRSASLAIPGGGSTCGG